jgi:hypothetical protein
MWALQPEARALGVEPPFSLRHLEPGDAWIIGPAFVSLFNDMDKIGLRNAEGTVRKIVKRCFEAQTQQCVTSRQKR